MIFRIARRLGTLRGLLVLLTLAIILAMPFADISGSPEGWGMIRSAVLPASGPIIFMVLMMDLLMCQVFKADAGQERRADLNFISILYLILAALLALVWLPLFLQAT